MTLKVVFERSSGRILGAQAVGREGVEKRIDVIATAMRARMTASDLTELDLCYAPPYSSAKDPVNMAGYIIENVLEGRVRKVTWDDVAAVAEKGIRDADEAESPRPPLVLLDCRTDGEFARSHIEGALHIPLDDLRDRLDLLSPDWEIWVYCQSGLRSYVACRILEQHGFSCANIAGGYGFYEQTALDRSVRTDGVGPCGMAAE